MDSTIQIYDLLCQDSQSGPDSGRDSNLDTKTASEPCRADDRRIYLNYKSGSSVPAYDRIPGHQDEVTAVSWAPSGRQLVSVSKDRTIRVWDVSTTVAVELHESKAPSAVWAVDWSPNGERIVSSQGGVQFHDLWYLDREEGKDRDEARRCLWSDEDEGDDGGRLKTPPLDWRTRCGRVSTYDAKDLNTQAELAAAPLLFAFPGAPSWDLNAQGMCDAANMQRWLASEHQASSATLIDYQEEQYLFRNKYWNSTAADPLPAPVVDSTPACENGDAPPVMCMPWVCRDSLCPIAWSPDGTRIASAVGIKHEWSKIQTADSEIYGCSDDTHRHCVQEYLSSHPMGLVGMLDAQNLTRGFVQQLGLPPMNSDEGNWVNPKRNDEGEVLDEGNWPRGQYKPRAEACDTVEGYYSPQNTHAVAFSPDGSKLATGGEDGGIMIWDAADMGHGPLQTTYADGPISAIVWSPDSTRIATATNMALQNDMRQVDGDISNDYDYEGETFDTFEEVPPEFDEECRKALIRLRQEEFCEDCRQHIPCATVGTIAIWDTEDLDEGPLQSGSYHNLVSLSYSPDGLQLASASYRNAKDPEDSLQEYRHLLAVWNVADLEEPVATATDLSDSRGLTAVEWSPDGSMIATASDALVIWNAEDLSEPLLVGKGHAKRISCSHGRPTARESSQGRTTALSGSGTLGT